MLIQRWQALKTPSEAQIRNLLIQEGLEPFLRVVSEDTLISYPRFDEVAILSQGEAILKFGSRQILLKEGDRILIPAGTRYTQTAKTSKCHFVCAYRL